MNRALLFPLALVLVFTLPACAKAKRHLADTETSATRSEVMKHINDMNAAQKIELAQKELGGEHKLEGVDHTWYGSTADGEHCDYLWLSTENKFAGGTAKKEDCDKYNPKP